MFDRSRFRNEYPFQSRWLELRHAGQALRLHYVDEGPRTHGRAVVMVHGNPTWSFYYRNLIRALRPTHRCIALDHMGCGLSDKPQDYPYRLAQHIENLTALLDELKLTDVTLVVHDWGGAIGMGAAGRLPERITRLVVLNTAAFRSARIPLRIAMCRWPYVGPFAVRGLNGFARAALYMAVDRLDSLDADARAGLIAPYDSWANRVAIQRFVEDIPMAPEHPSWNTLTEVERNLPSFREHPMLICWGMKDWCFSPEFLAEWERRFPNANVHRFTDTGHYVMEEARHAVIARIGAFLKR